jgi:hypothetical protein
MTSASGAASARPAPAAPGSACGTGHRVAALYVSLDGTYQVRYGLAGPPYGQCKPPQDGHHPGGERTVTLSADADEARLLAPAWQETASAIRLCLPSLPPAALGAYARALHAEAALRAFDYRINCPAPFYYRDDYNRALITSALEALSHGDPAAIRQDPDGTWEVSATGILTAIPAVLPRKPGNASTAPEPRPWLRLVRDGQR